MATDSTFDYIIAGGGLSGCVIASRLSQAGYHVAVVEAGGGDFPDEIMNPLGAALLHGSKWEWNLKTTPQTTLGSRQIDNYIGKTLSGSSAVNYGLWTRCHSVDYDLWAERVDDKRWSYSGLLPYFLKSQHHHDPLGSPEVYGFEGPMYTTAAARTYPLRDKVSQALTSAGLTFNPDANGGNPLGFGVFTENWKDAKRQPAALVYGLSKAVVITHTLVSSVIIDEHTLTATGISLADGRKLTANREVILCCGALKTPQLMMLSGLGPRAHLTAHGIPTIQDLSVGQNLHDHCSVAIFWKLKHPERGLAMGSASFMQIPNVLSGNPMEWLATSSIPDSPKAKAAHADGLASDDPQINQPRGHVEMFVAYAPVGGGSFHLDFDGTHIATPIVSLLPTSRGSVTLASTDPAADPIVDPQYMQTECDRAAMRSGFRLAMRTMLDTPEGQSFVDGEVPPPGDAKLTSACSDDDIDRRIRTVGSSFYQNAGTAEMGKVVDTALRVKGVKNLRVADASILPLPLAGHYQCKLFGLGRAK